jgi:predicted dehydrogenase
VAAASPGDVDVRGASAAIIATPPEHHCAWALRYLEAGAHVLIEKPAVLTLDEFARLAEASRASGRAVLAAHVRRLYPSVNAAREAVLSGRIGRITGVDAYSGLRWNWPSRSDFPISSPAGGVLYDFGSHVLDAALFICGVEDTAWSDVAAERLRVDRWPEREPSHDVAADVVLRGSAFEIPVTLRLSRREPLANVVRVRGERGDILVDVWFRPACLIKTNGAWTPVAGKIPVPYADSTSGCYLAEDLELWRVWAGREQDSPLALAHFGLLTGLLEMLAAGRG